MAVAVVKGTRPSTVALDRSAAPRVRLDVVHLCDRVFAGVVEALAVTHFDGAARRTGEQPAPHANVDHAGRTVEHDALHPGAINPRDERTRRHDRAVRQL